MKQREVLISAPKVGGDVLLGRLKGDDALKPGIKGSKLSK